MRIAGVSVAAVLLVYGSILGGCASTDAHVTPVYTVEPGKKSPLSTIPPLAVAVQVEDQRNQFELDRVGNKKNGYGQNMAKVIPDKAPADILREALKAELEANSHKVVAPGVTQADALVKVGLKRFWSEATIHFFDIEMVSTLETDIGILNGTGQDKLSSKPLTSTFRDSRQFAGEGAFEDSLKGALLEYVRTFSRDPAVLDALRAVGPRK
ncbi:MAG: hypothetical protein LZF62_310049 [Nitrospira sp.]|nr:MAG: hypothetical protein LZF62_310049 [Nitrospira sp.]